MIDADLPLLQTSNDFRFAAAVAEFGMLLRDSKFRGNSTYNGVAELARASRGEDLEGYRQEFIRLVETCGIMSVDGRSVD